MSQPEAAKFNGNWKTLFICPNPKISRELAGLFSHLVPSFSAFDLDAYPMRHQMAKVIAEQTPQLCLIEVSEPYEGALAIIPDLQRIDAKLPIIAVLSSNDSELILRCLRQGASDFLIAPFTSEQVEAALQKIAKLNPARVQHPGKVYCFMPAKGGCGATTIASNLAYQLRRATDKRILLADLDPLAGTLSFLLKIKSSYSFIDALARSHDIDADLWKSVVNNRQGVDVLLAPEVMTEGMSELSDASPVIEYTRGIYDLVVLDAGSVYGDWNLSQAQHSDEIFLVTTNELTALQAVQRALSYLDANGVERFKIKLIVNRYDRHVGLSKDVIGTALHTDIFHLMPADYESIQKALMEGKPLAPTTNFGKSITALADRLSDKSGAHSKNTSLSGLLSLFSRTS